MASKRSRRAVRALGVTVLGASVTLGLSGCFSVTANVAIDSNANTTGTVAVGFQKSTMSMLGVGFDEFAKEFSDQINDPDSSSADSEGIDKASCKPTQTASEFVMTCNLTDGASMGEGWTVTKSGDSITLDYSKKGLGDLVGSADSSGLGGLLGGSGPLGQLGGGSGNLESGLGDIASGASKMMSGVTYTINVQFPGDITSVSGTGVTQTSDTAVSISVPLLDTADVSVTSNATPGTTGVSTGTVVLIVVVVVLALLVIALLVLVVWLLLRRRHETAPTMVAGPAAVVPAAPEAAPGATPEGMPGPPTDAPTQQLPPSPPQEPQP